MPTAASGGRLRAGRRTARPDTRPYARLRSAPMTILEHDYGIPSEDELARLVGAATPHFALQIRDRVRAYADALPEAHPRRAGIDAQVARLEVLAVDGQCGPAGDIDLPPRPSLDVDR